MRFLGKYSYGIYVYQGLLFGVLTEYLLPVDWMHKATGHYLTSVVVHFLAATVVVVGIAWVSWNL